MSTAFVAHSFAKEDESHVNAFLEFLSGVSKVNPKFSWTHARDAEPRDVRDKVLDVSARADFFIAICSKKERVFDPGTGRRTLLNSSKLVINEDQCPWITSSWIVQEIGLAIGRNLPVILLVELGVRSPGGMQGNLEYIEFDRVSPGDCFVRLSEMLGKLTADAAAEDQEARADVKAEEGADDARSPTVEQSLEPTGAMDLLELQKGLLMSYAAKEVALAERYKSTFLESSFGASEEARAEWDSRQNWLSQVFLGISDVNAIADLAKRFPGNAEIGTSYARLLNVLGESAAAAAEFERVAKLNIGNAERVQRLCDSARVLVQSGESGTAISLLRGAMSSLSEDEDFNGRASIASVLGEILESKDKFLKASLSEHILQLRPGDFEARFQLAYLYGEIPMPAQAMHNYLRIPETRRPHWGWNNLGVAFGNVGAKGRAVAAYKIAEREGNELAISNRARLLRDAGFLDEADEAVRKALRAGAEEPALAETLTSIVTQRDEEERVIESRTAEARRIEAIAKAFGRAMLTPARFEWSGEWLSTGFSIYIENKGDHIEGVGSYVRDRGLLTRLPSIVTNNEQNKETVIVKISAEIISSGAFGSIERNVEGRGIGLLGGASTEKLLIWFEASDRVLHMVERKSPLEFVDRIFRKK